MVVRLTSFPGSFAAVLRKLTGGASPFKFVQQSNYSLGFPATLHLPRRQQHLFR
jgi:hypothetical protein